MAQILIVDDKEENLYYLEALLRSQGFSTETARHGLEALEKARRDPPELVVSDLLMPTMDGYTLLRHWKADGSLKPIPFVVYTATYTGVEDERLALNLGADAFILKPAEPEDFVARIREVRSAATAAEPTVPRDPVENETALFKGYSETLIRKLEDKTVELEEANRALQRDIAERKRAEAALRESELRLRQLAENINEVFWMTDLAGTELLYVSPAYERIWGRSCADLHANPGAWLEAIRSEDRERVARAAPNARKSGGYDETYRIVRPDGAVRWVRDRGFPVADERGEPYRVVGTAEDITERKELEAQFLRSQRMESIGTLAGGIAHDLNNLLAPILLSVCLLRRDVAGEDGRELLSTLETCARGAADLVQQVLAFARGVEGRRIAIDLTQLLGDIRRIVRETFPKDIECRSESPDDLWSVVGDPTQLHQVLMNLCVNARDAMPRGGSLTITMRNVVFDGFLAGRAAAARPGSYAIVEVEDTGTGIPIEIRDRIFEPFFSTKPSGQGTGLGLSTSMAIVRSHGGFIDVRSELGRGTRFAVYLPASKAPPEVVTPVEANLAELPQGQGERVLVVDDEEGIRNVARKTLERFGYRVLLAANGAEAIALYALHRQSIAVVLTDMAMPVLGGQATVAGLRAMNPDVRIVGTSGVDSREHVGKHGGTELRHFVPKPYTAERLLTAIARALADPV